MAGEALTLVHDVGKPVVYNLGSLNRRYVNYAAERASWASPNGGDLRHRLDTIRIRRMAQNVAPTHEIERQSRWKQDGGRVGCYTHGDTADSALRYI